MIARRFIRALVLGTSVALLTAPAAFADTVVITNDVGLNTNTTKSPGDAGTGYVVLNVTNGVPAGDTSGCNANGANPLTVSLTSDNADLNLDSPGQVVITGCGVAMSFAYTVSAAASAGTAHVSVSGLFGGVTSGTRLYNTTDTLTVTITPPPNTAPSVSVSGVVDGASYNKGSVPAAVCSVIDAEDGNSSFAASLSAITGTYAADGIGSQTASCSYTDGGGLSDSDAVTYSIVDPSAPDISYTLSPSTPDGDNDWYKSNVSLAWTVTESESPSSLVKSGCVDQAITSDQAATIYSCSATSAGGSTGPVDVTIKRDATAPTISGSAAPAPNAAGWNNTDVTVSFTCTDNLSGVASCGPDDTISSEGADQSVTGNVTDNAGNSNSVAVSNIDIDKTAPTVAVTGFGDGNVFIVGGTLPTVGCSSSDGLSGIAATGGPSLTAGGLNSNGVGSVTFTCTASDNAGNPATASKSYSVVYGGVTGILQPINPDNTSVFKRGQAVPVKFKLAGDETFGFVTTGWVIQRQSVSCGVFDGEDAVLESVPSNTPTAYFRYDASADQYIYNADMHTLGVGTCWNFKVTLDSGQIMYSAVFKLAK